LGKATFILRPIRPDDIEGAMRLSTQAGWNQTEKDWKLLMKNPQNACIVAEYDKKVIGTTTAINYSNQIAWIGMVLVDQEYRGQGISKALLADIFKKAKCYQSVKLDATPQGQPVYKKFGFIEEYMIDRMTNMAVQKLTLVNNMAPEPVQLKDIEEIIALDNLIFGADRTQLIEFLIKEYPDKSWLIKQNDRIAGFVLGRVGRKYHHIGPVVASNQGDAKILITKALNTLVNQAVVVDILHDKEDMTNWLNSIGFIKQRHFIRMYKKENPLPGISDKQYLICGPEFG
jgi:GNAT superfamily N-acetyltransferase